MNRQNDYSPEIEEAYGDYTPLSDYPKLLREMLTVLPAAYLEGLDRISLRKGLAGNRKHRRSSYRSRGRKGFHHESRGFYQPRGQGNPAFVVLHIDHIDETYRILLKLPFISSPVRSYRIAEVLFHEIGHHIHLTKHREYGEMENIADDYATYYLMKYHRRKHWLFHAFLRTFRRPIGVFVRKFRSRNRKKTRVLSTMRQRELARLESEAVLSIKNES